MYNIMAIKVIPRNSLAPKVQEILTRYGCIIHTRLGIHEASADKCSASGLILLSLLSESTDEIDKLYKELSELDGVKVKMMDI